MCFLPGSKIFPFLILLSFSLCNAQGLNYGKKTFQRITNDNGLSQNYVTSLLQDNTGFIWIGTKDGLNKYDGSSFTVYYKEPDDPASLPDNCITAIAQGAQKSIWIGTNNSGIAGFSPEMNKFTNFKNDPQNPYSLNSDRITCLLPRSDGTLWVGTENGLDLFSPATGKAIHLGNGSDKDQKIAGQSIHAIAEDGSGSTFIGSEKGISVLRNGKLQYLKIQLQGRDIGAYSVEALLHDKTGNLWAATRFGVLRLAEYSFIQGRSSAELICETTASDLKDGRKDITAIYQESDSVIVWGKTNGMRYYNLRSGKGGDVLVDYHDDTKLAGGAVCFLKDMTGVFWVGTNGSGLEKLVPDVNRITTYRATPSLLACQSVRSIFLDHSNRIWIGGYYGLSIFDRNSNSFIANTVTKEINHNSRVSVTVRCIYPDPTNTSVLWVGTEDHGLYKFNQSSDQLTHFISVNKADFSSMIVHSVMRAKNGDLYVAARNGLYKAQESQNIYCRVLFATNTGTGLDTVQIMAVTELSQAPGWLWLSTSQGLVLFEPATKRFFKYGRIIGDPLSLSNSQINCVLSDRAGNVWIATESGLNKTKVDNSFPDKLSFTHFLIQDGLPNSFIYGVLEDSFGSIWVSTNLGLSRLSPATKRFKNFTVSDGLQANEFNYGAFCQSWNGELFFGGINGVNCINPTDKSQKALHAKVLFTRFEVGDNVITGAEKRNYLDKEISFASTVKLTYEDRMFVFEFVSLDYSAPGSISYAYKMEGFDEDWVYMGNRHRVRFMNLPPGEYILYVKASNGDGIWNPVPAAIRIIIAPPFWQRWWFRLLIILSLILLFTYVYRAKVNSIRMKFESEAAVKLSLAEKSKVETELKKIDKRYQELVERINDIYYIADQDGVIVYGSPSLFMQTGYNHNEVIGKSYVRLIARQDRRAVRQRYHDLAKSQENSTLCEFRARRKDGSEFWLEQSTQLVRDENGVAIEYVNVIRDITEKKVADLLIRENEERFRTLFETMVQGVIYYDEKGLVVNVNSAAQQILGFSRNQLLGKKTVDFAWPAINPDGTNFAKESYPAVVSLATGLPVRDVILGLFNPVKNSFIWLNINSTPQYKPGEIKPSLVYTTFEDITKIIKAEEALRESEELFKALINNSSDSIVLLDDSANYQYISPSFAAITGYEVEEKLGQNALPDIHPADLHRVRNQFLEGLNSESGRSPYVQYRFRMQNGIYTHFESIGLRLLNKPSLNGILINTRDISKRIEMEQNLLLFAHTIRNISDCVTITDINHRFIYVNEAFERTYGYPMAEVVGKEASILNNFTTEETNERRKESLSNAWSGELINQKKDGTLFPVSLTTSAILDENQIILGIVGVSRDITEQKKVETAIKESEQRYRLLADNAADFIVVYNFYPTPHYAYVSPSCEAMTGYSPYEFYSDANIRQKLYAPEDFERFNLWFDPIYVFETAVEQQWFKKNGEVIWVEHSSKRHFDDNGVLISFQSAIRDITKRKKAEEKLQKSTERYRTVADYTYDWEYWIDQHDEIAYMSPAVERITGYEQNDFIINPEMLEQIVYEEDKLLWDAHRTRHSESKNAAEEIEFRIVTKTGEVKWISHVCRHIWTNEEEYLGIRASNKDITENKLSLDVIHKLSTAMEQSPFTVLITDTEGNIEYANLHATKISGFTIEEMIGKTPRIFKSEANPPGMYENLWKTIIAGKIWEGELVNKKKNGETFWEFARISPLYNTAGKLTHYLAVKDDISARKRIEEELREYREMLESLVTDRTRELRQSEEKFRALSNNSEDIIMRFDSDLHFLYVNPIIKKYTDMVAGDYIGKKITEMGFPDNLVAIWKDALQRTFLDKQILRFEFQLLSAHWMDWIVMPEFEEDGSVLTVITSARDITEMKKSEENINRALHREKELSELKTKFISTASHEFRTPLAVISSSSQMIRRYYNKWSEAKLMQHYDRISESIQHLTELMDDILFLSKSEAGINSPRIEQIPIGKYIREFIGEVTPLAADTHTIVFEMADRQYEMCTDRKLLRQIIINLLTNAVKYSPRGGQVTLNVTIEETQVKIAITDNGIGIAEKDIKHIFTPFYRTDEVVNIQGTGLGLDIVKRSVESLGGEILVFSEPGKGSSFVVLLPIRQQ